MRRHERTARPRPRLAASKECELANVIRGESRTSVAQVDERVKSGNASRIVLHLLSVLDDLFLRHRADVRDLQEPPLGVHRVLNGHGGVFSPAEAKRAIAGLLSVHLFTR